MKNWRYDLYLKTAQMKMDTLINRYHSMRYRATNWLLRESEREREREREGGREGGREGEGEGERERERESVILFVVSAFGRIWMLSNLFIRTRHHETAAKFENGLKDFAAMHVSYMPNLICKSTQFH